MFLTNSKCNLKAHRNKQKKYMKILPLHCVVTQQMRNFNVS